MAKSLASKTGQVKYLQKGEPGDKGPMGPLLYPSGEYSSTTTYIRTALSAAMVLCDKQYYALNKEGSFKGINPKTDYAANGNKATWVLMEHVMYAFYEMFMANFAKLASAVFYGQYMFSQQGTNATGVATSDYTKFGTDEFTPNLMLDFLRGRFKGREVEVEGSIITPYSRILLEPNVPMVYAVSGRVNAYIDCQGDGVDDYTLFMPAAQDMRAGTEVNLFYYVRPGRVAPKPYIKIYPGVEKFLPDNVTEVWIGESKELQLKVVRIGPNETDKRWLIVNT